MATYDDRGLLQGYFDTSCMLSRFSGHVLGILLAIPDAPWAHGRYVLGSLPIVCGFSLDNPGAVL